MLGHRRRHPSVARPTPHSIRLAALAVVALLVGACGTTATPSASAPPASASAGAPSQAASPSAAGTLSVFGAFATEIEEPWDGVIHSALEDEKAAGRIAYEFTDAIGYSGDMERVLREVAERDQPAIIFGDAFGNEEAVRRVAAEYPDIAFVFGSGGGPAEPNFSVFDNWIHEPAYLAGMLAGGLTKSNTLGVVGGYPSPRGQPHRQRVHRRRQGDQPERRGQGHVPQQLVRPGGRQGGGAGPGRRGRGRPVRRAIRRHRGGVGERPGRDRQHERPEGAGATSTS